MLILFQKNTNLHLKPTAISEVKKPLPQLQRNSETKYQQECQITVCLHGNTFAKDPSVAVDRETGFFRAKTNLKDRLFGNVYRTTDRN